MNYRILAALFLTACTGKDGDTSGTAEVSCATYCTTYAANCTGDNFSYTDTSDCETQCATLTQGTPGGEDVDTLECRYVHAQEANEDDHCGEAAFDSTSCI